MNELTETRSIETITTEILFYKHQAGFSILEIGKRLIEAKEQLNHGEWLPWLKEKVDFSEDNAQRFMKLAREYANTESIRYLGPTKAFALLAVPADEREDFAEEVKAEQLSVRQLKEAIRQREEERDAAQRAAEKKEKELQLQIERTASLQQDKQQLTEQVKELEARPVEVATVDASAEQIEAAERRGREASAQELEMTKRQLSEQIKQVSRLNQRTSELQREVRDLQQQEADNYGDPKIDQTLGEINALFRQIQQAHNRITGLMELLDDISKKRVTDARRRLLHRLLAEAEKG